MFEKYISKKYFVIRGTKQYVPRYFEVFDITNFVIFKTSQKSKSTEILFCCHNQLNNTFSKNTFFGFKIVPFEVSENFPKITIKKFFEIPQERQLFI